VYAPKLPGWLHARWLSIRDDATPAMVSVSLLGRRPRIRRDQHQPGVQLPRVLGVRSGPSWDEVRMRLVAGQKPEDVEEATRALACIRKVARCQIRELPQT
jgi:S-DNA-T family DNA segregation ATPase FtsK/SpoIIIE